MVAAAVAPTCFARHQKIVLFTKVRVVDRREASKNAKLVVKNSKMKC